MNILMVILIGLSLSMDTFSLSLNIGTLGTTKKRYVIYSLMVGFFHFAFPLIGHLFSVSIRPILTVNLDTLLTIIFAFLSIEMLFSFFSKEEKKFSFNYFDMIICAISVSIDSFTIGIGLWGSIENILICSIVFFILSTFFTYYGFKVGSFCKYKFGKVANLFGFFIIILLIILKQL